VSFVVVNYLHVELRFRHRRSHKRLEVREAREVGRLVEVVRVLVEPHVQRLPQRFAVLEGKIGHQRFAVANKQV